MLQYKNRFKILLSSATVISMLFACSYTPGTFSLNVEEKKKIKNHLQTKSEELRKELISTQKNIEEETKNKEKLDAQIKEVEEKIDRSNEYINNLRQQIVSIEEHIKEIEEDIDKKAELLKEALVLMYKAGDATTIDIVLGSKNFKDFLEKSDIVKSVSDKIEEIINSLNEKSAELSEEKNSLDETKKKQEEENKILEENKIELEELIKKSDELLENYQNEKENAEKQIEETDEDIKAVEKLINEYYAEQRRKEEEKRSKNKGQPQKPIEDSSYVVNQGDYEWPVPGFTRITSGFGDREGRSKPHGAIDIGRTNGKNIYGADVVAAGSGIVISAGVIGGYGNSILIDHGNKVVTRYSHLSKIAVCAKQKVSRKQIIGQVGSTGFSTGPHLDFEFIVDGVKKDPTKYVKPNPVPLS